MLVLPCESIFSAFFRLYKKHGELDYSSLIGIDGKWCVSPTLNKPYREVFKVYNGSKIYEMFFPSFFRMIDVYSSHLKLATIKSLVLAFESERTISFKMKKGCRYIRFCDKCIVESINNYGVGYLKSSWLEVYNCEVHNKKLFYLPNASRHQQLERLTKVLSGSFEVGEIPCEVSNYSYEKWNESISTYNNCVIELPCVDSGYSVYVSKSIVSIIEEMGYNHNVLADESLQQACGMLNLDYDSLWGEYLKSSVKSTCLRIVFMESHFSIHTQMLSGSNCSKCLRYHPCLEGACPRSLIIMRVKVGGPGFYFDLPQACKNWCKFK
ncbi:hypothetical protein [Shewanella sp. Isolate7]|uniref:hypothetical protein n=1 Tax=Shewanella sp. Isolate7 TaxID=2908528 RepID=UPI001EFE6905|nr:hypothetical protein [Shewanella sp. Isolate7]MCG9723138.1 hypothetical protein [Shewanella sp. Isolate7]